MQALHTPCFILDQDELVKSIQGFKDALSNFFSSFIVGYSVKTNSLPYCLKIAKQYGCYAEVVSFDEYNDRFYEEAGETLKKVNEKYVILTRM